MRFPASARNLLVDAKITSNLLDYEQGRRGEPDHMVYSIQRGRFVKDSKWHEFGVGFGKTLGVVSEEEPAFWMAEWPKPVEANTIVLSGVYPNQPQPDTCWSIELRREGKWAVHARGKGGWFDSGRYVWGGKGHEPLRCDGLRVNVFSPDDQTPLKSIHFRGEEGVSWVVADLPLLEARIAPLSKPVLVGTPVRFTGKASLGDIETFTWDFGGGKTARGVEVEHAFATDGIVQVKLSVSDGKHHDTRAAIVRVHTPETRHVPQVFLDTDQKNEVDDQHYFAYALFSELDVLGINSVHHGGGQEPTNYAEILNVLDLAKQSGLPAHREPLVFRGANRRLDVPASGAWHDTTPIITDASEGILAAARGASPANPLWVVPVGPGTNAASAILQARAEGLDLADRMKVMWLGGSKKAITGEFNGNNDPWSMYVVAHSGIETWIVPAPVGGRIRMDVRKEANLYADTPLGNYLRKIVPKRNKALYDPSALAAIISMRLGLDWLTEVEPVTIAGPKGDYRWTKTDAATSVRVIRQIDVDAMKRDIFDTMKGKPSRLIGIPPEKSD